MSTPELRQDPATRDWIVVAPASNKEPVASHDQSYDATHEDSLCPFCPGNESRSPGELYRTGGENSEWLSRVVPNKYPTLLPEITTERGKGFFLWSPGVGHHEIIIESPHHLADFSNMSADAIESVLHVYRSRQQNAMMDPRIHFVALFRNHGEKAGASVIHPHAQLFAAPMIPVSARHRYQVAIDHFERTGRCLYSDIREEEWREGARLVSDIDGYTSFVPFAARLPYEIWILPRKLEPSFGRADDNDLAGLARTICDSLTRLKGILGDFDYNLIIDSSARDYVAGSYLWNVRILPRLDRVSGFEMSTGMSVNTMLPETAAEHLRSMRPATIRPERELVTADS